MLGIDDGWVVAAYLLCLGSTLLCVVYGALTWNRGEEQVKKEDIDWAKEEKEDVEEAV